MSYHKTVTGKFSTDLSSVGGTYSSAKNLTTQALQRFIGTTSPSTHLAALGVGLGYSNMQGMLAAKALGQDNSTAVKTGLLNSVNKLKSFVSDVSGSIPTSTPTTPTPTPTTPAPSPVTVQSDGGTSVTMPEYLYADLAKAYGMDASTAYQEALSNTSYQRAVQDLQAAGINPLMAVGGYANGASGVYAAHLAGSGVGASPVSTGVSSAKGAHTWYNILSNVGSIGGAIVTGGSYLGAKTGEKVLGAVGNLIDKFVG